MWKTANSNLQQKITDIHLLKCFNINQSQQFNAFFNILRDYIHESASSNLNYHKFKKLILQTDCQ